MQGEDPVGKFTGKKVAIIGAGRRGQRALNNSCGAVTG
jgi:NADPH-dependent glutamate synthase beta subunit-like oxidoreductase